MLPDFFIFCDVLHCYLCIWSSSHLFKSLLTTFVRKLTSVNFARESVAVLDLLWAHLLRLLAPICGRIIQLVCLLWILEHASLSFQRASSCFSERMLKPECVLFLWSEDSDAFICVLTGHLFSLPPTRGVCRGSWPQGVVDLWVRHSIKFSDWSLDWIQSVLIDSGVCTPLMSPGESCSWPLSICWIPILEFRFSSLDGAGRIGMPSIVYAWRSQVLTHTCPSLPREKTMARKTSVVSKLCHLWGGAYMKKVGLALLAHSSAYK